ncbi:hypothetical protein NPIL_387521 [Nephila pilipes]|uniref:Uncharacterized protein n=1 Tax=Nephila pilipes TaxID=299642 RepID=A0A8X6TA50_NEPPI|nr:hypothetical protein NPIL_387521 [Nephila pilipes]
MHSTRIGYLRRNGMSLALAHSPVGSQESSDRIWRGFGPHTDGMGVEVCPVHKTDFEKALLLTLPAPKGWINKMNCVY